MRELRQDLIVYLSILEKRNGTSLRARVSRLRATRRNGPNGNEHLRMLRIERATNPDYHPRNYTELQKEIARYADDE